MRHASALLLALSLLCSLVGCSASTAITVTPPGRTASDAGPPASDSAVCDPGDERPLGVYFGTREPTTLPLTPGEILSIARVELGGLCSGTVVAPRWVLTAEHCLGGFGGRIRVGADPDRVRQEIRVRRQIAHPSLDMALLELAQDAPSAVPGLVPIRVADFPAPELVGQIGEAAGYGQREDGESGARRFSAEPIVDVRGEEITIDGMGERGVCFGDSGGPLMVVAGDMSVRVVGVLSWGDPSCVGRDHYTRVDLALDWIEETIGETPPTEPGCDGVTEAGVCRGATAVWCERDMLRMDTCSPDELCTMSMAEGRVTCMPRTMDPCGGVDAVGRCEGGVAVWCQGGTVRRADCGSCGLGCGFVESRGGVYCE